MSKPRAGAFPLKFSQGMRNADEPQPIKKKKWSPTELELLGENSSFISVAVLFQWHNPDKPEPNRKKLAVSGFYESPGSKI
jgi:hypothetical protein